MKAVVLVGGEGTRLRPLTFTTPKPLLPIANQPFLERQLLALADHGVDEVVLSMGYLPDAFHEHFRDESGEDTFRGIRLRYAVEDEPLGTAGAIRFAAQEGGIDERFVVCNGDVLTSLDLTAMVEFHDACGAEVTISLTRVDDPSAFGVVPTAADGAVISFVEKPPRGSAPSNWINAGTYVIEPPFLDRIPPRLSVSVERETFPRLLEQAGRLFGYKTDAYWLDIGTPEKYLQAHLDVLRGSVGRPPTPGAKLLSEDIWAQGDATIEPGATVLAPALLGAGAHVQSGARVRGSVLGAGVIVEQGAVLETAVLHDEARVSHDSTIDHSVIGRNTVVKPDVLLTDHTIVGADVTVASGTRISAGRYPSERE
jgi:NDP-sugar pyrophosphorylase family protein